VRLESRRPGAREKCDMSYFSGSLKTRTEKLRTEIIRPMSGPEIIGSQKFGRGIT
jgi:hypothetical protein